MYKTLIPKIFYEDLQSGIGTFIGGLNCKIIYDGRDEKQPFIQVGKDGIMLQIVQNADLTGKDRPELFIETDNIKSVYLEVTQKNPGLLHPDLKSITLRPWNALEFAVRDATGVCIIFRQWQ